VCYRILTQLLNTLSLSAFSMCLVSNHIVNIYPVDKLVVASVTISVGVSAVPVSVVDGGSGVSVCWSGVRCVSRKGSVGRSRVRSCHLHGSSVDRAGRDRLAEGGGDGSEGRLRGLGARLVGLDSGAESELVSNILDGAVTAVDLTEIVRSYDVPMSALLGTAVNVAPVVLDVIAEGVVAEIVLLAVVR
jgi:hypothetical protein